MNECEENSENLGNGGQLNGWEIKFTTTTTTRYKYSIQNNKHREKIINKKKCTKTNGKKRISDSIEEVGNNNFWEKKGNSTIKRTKIRKSAFLRKNYFILLNFIK